MSICQKVARAWYGSRDRGGVEVPVGVIASLAVLEQPEDGPEVSTRLLGFSPEQLVTHYRSLWALLWLIRPELADWARPVRSWLEQSGLSRERMDAVHAVTQAALKAGLLDVTGSVDPYRRSRVDVFSVLLTELRSVGASRVIGEFHTPPDAADLMVSLTLQDESRPGQWFYDPTAGTGGLFRVIAQHLRETGRDPGEFGWSLNDVDPIAAACCAVNAYIWGLGPRVLVACSDVLEQPHRHVQALEERAAAFTRRAALISAAEPLAMLHKLLPDVSGMETG
ncbi:N-6 DNA methylase [Streptomyces antimycoticus]|uniref:N-6 DNA methylase n=1 Tax=Streptomyces antimycoticus TaxID=68175 RepID=UPI0038233C31